MYVERITKESRLLAIEILEDKDEDVGFFKRLRSGVLGGFSSTQVDGVNSIDLDFIAHTRVP